ncbi:MAG: hypothetical protein KDB18_05235, partial [Salinibacterium sp.]|nr:hypothetical protein [Salinibacterium sp.]
SLLSGGKARGSSCPNLIDWLRSVLDRRKLRVVPSLDAERFPAGAMERFTSSEYVVDEHSNRVGVRLRGPAVRCPEDGDWQESEPTVSGGVQVPSDGQPIILGVDRPTTGGYPVLACVIGADLPSMAMIRPRETVRFEFTSLADARRMTAEQIRTLDTLLPPSGEHLRP